MRDAKLVEAFAVPEIFVDGFSDHIVRNGVMTCAGYRLMPPISPDLEPQRVAVVRLVMPAANLNEAIADAQAAQRAPFYVTEHGEKAGRH